MNAQRIDIGKGQWIELKDSLFIHVRTRRRWCLDIFVAPLERVKLLRRGEPPLLRTIPFVSYAALFGAPVFAVCVLVALAAKRDQPLYALGLAAVCSLAITALFAAGMLLYGRIRGRRETALYASGSFYDPVMRFAHEEGTNPELEAFLGTLPTGYADVSPATLLGEMYRLPSPWRSFLGTIYWLPWLYMAWAQQYHGPYSATFVRVCSGALFALFGVVFGAQTLFYLRNPKATKLARAAMFDGDYDAAALVLDRVLEESPGNPYANYLQMGVALLQGDLERASSCAEVVKGSRILQYLWPPLFGVAACMPSAENLRALAAHVSAAGEAQPIEDLLPPISPIAPVR